MLALLAADLSRSPTGQLTARVIITGVRAYRVTLGRLDSAAGIRCRFDPSCGHYAEEAIRRHGALHGGLLTLRRLVRCGPWTPRGSFDPVPPVPRKP